RARARALSRAWETRPSISSWFTALPQQAFELHRLSGRQLADEVLADVSRHARHGGPLGEERCKVRPGPFRRAYDDDIGPIGHEDGVEHVLRRLAALRPDER